MDPQRPPKSAAIFEPEECRSALMHFCIIYLRYLPLIHLLEKPQYEVAISWEPEPEPEPTEPQDSIETPKQKLEGEHKDEKKEKTKKGKNK